MDFVALEQEKFLKYDGKTEKSKWTFDKVEDTHFPEVAKQILQYLNSPLFVSTLREISWIDNLIPDHSYTGGGIHITYKDWILNPHKDFNILPATLQRKTQWYRVLNIITYINPELTPDDKGQLILWKEDHTKNREQDPTGMLEEISVNPTFNTSVLFDTRNAIHGQKEPYNWKTPRVSLATYYYIPIKAGDITPHSTVYYLLPHQTETEEERLARIKRASTDRYKGDEYLPTFQRFEKLNSNLLANQ